MMARWLNIPPVWLALALGIACFQARYFHLGLSLSHPITDMLAGLSIGAGVLLMAMAVLEMRWHRTTVIPTARPIIWLQQVCLNGRLTRFTLGTLWSYWDLFCTGMRCYR